MIFKKFKDEMNKALKKQEIYKTHPNSPEAKAMARKGGVALLVFGFIFLLTSYLEWTYASKVHIIFPVSGVVFVLFGVITVVKGKMIR